MRTAATCEGVPGRQFRETAGQKVVKVVKAVKAVKAVRSRVVGRLPRGRREKGFTDFINFTDHEN